MGRGVTECGCCGSPRLELVLQLADTPPTCHMLHIGDDRDQEAFPLELLECQDCRLVQLSCIVDPEIVFPPDYPYSSGNSGQLRKHFAEFAGKLNVARDDLVVDIGANDGTFLSNLDCRTVAIDPTWQVLRAAADVQVNEFFTAALARDLCQEYGPARYVTASNVLAHVADPHDFLEGVRILLAPDGRFVTENHDLDSVVNGRQWDTIYHEHLRYYSRGSLSRLLERHGLHVFAEEAIDTHGGSFRTWASLEPSLEGIDFNTVPQFDWKRLREDVARTRWYLRSLVSSIRAVGERVGAVGATARATTVLGVCGFDCDDIEAVYEVAGSDKIGRYMPGTRIPVVDEEALAGPDAPENLILFLWYLEDLIVPKLRELGYQGEIIRPLPDPKYSYVGAAQC